MSGARNQHWLPQFYLRYFAVPGFRDKKNAKIWVMNTATGDLVLQKVRHVATKDYLYSHVKRDGSRCFRTEKKLAELETMTARLYPRIAEGVPDLAVAWGIKKLAALFIASLILRHPDEEEKTRACHQQLVAAIDQAPKDKTGSPRVSHFIYEDKKIPFDSSEYEEYRQADENVIKEMFASQIREVAVEIAELLFAKRWIFFCCEQPVFLTSDKPVIQMHTERRTFGLRTPGMHLWFPVTPKRILWMCDGGDGQPDGFYPFPEHEAVALNAFTMGHATRFLLSEESPNRRMQDVGLLYKRVRSDLL